MKKMITILTCLIFATMAFGQWETVKGPVVFDYPADAVALNATTILTVNGNVVQKTTDFGAHWTEILLPDDVSLTAIDAANETVAYACSDDGFVYKTIDAGDTWTQVGDTAQFKIDMDEIDVLDANTVFISGGAGSSATGYTGWFFKTTDGGANWDTTIVSDQILDGDVAFNDALNGIVFDDGTGGIIHTTHDGGATWSEYAVTAPFGITSKRMYTGIAAGANTYYIGSYYNVIWKSTDNGDTWSCISEYTYFLEYVKKVIAFDENTMMAWTSLSNILTTTDGGTTWDTLRTGTAQSGQTMAFSSLTNGMTWSSNGQDFSTVDGSTFVPMHDWPAVSLYGIAFPAQDKVFVTATSGGEVTMSDDNGNTFSYPSNVPTGFTSSIYKTEFISENVGLIGGSSGYIGKTIDGGETFTTIPTPMAELSNKHINMMHIAPNGDIFAGGSSGLVMKSTNDGDTWEMVSIEATQTVYDMCVFSNGMAMLGQGSGQFSVSTSTVLDTFEMVADYGSQSFREVKERNGVVLVAGTDGVYKTTTDALDTLIQIFVEPNTKDMYCITFINDSLVYAAGELGLVYVSSDTGATWQEVPNDAEKTIQGLRFNGEKLWAVGQEGIIMYLQVIETGISKSGIPDEYDLAQNYPNPFNPVTTLKFQVPNADMVNISVYNVTGRKVASLVNKQLEAGFYSVNFDASALPSGIYLYRLTAGEFSSVKKMTLLK
ncbi:MAG: T9SS type A sorting domain-containing protein [Candidatus Marinimicrobia bacterium]|nr:T9SS type A sorting domain-containing protein [Candidatus Neomarinimicrobiota bacterium]